MIMEGDGEGRRGVIILYEVCKKEVWVQICIGLGREGNKKDVRDT